MTYAFASLPKQKAALWMAAWAASFSSAMLMNKKVDPMLPSALLVWMRCFFGASFLGIILWRTETNPLKTKFPFVQIVRGLLVSAALLFTYMAYRHLPTHTAASLGTSGPLMTIVLSSIFLKEPLSWRQWGYLALGYSGVIMVLQPHQFQWNSFVFASLAGNFLSSIAILMARVLAVGNESAPTTLFYSTAMPLLVYSGLAFLFWQPIDMISLGSLAVMGAMGAFSQMCLFQALKLAPASFLAPFEYLRLCFLLPMGWLLFQEIPTLPIVGGLFLIILSSLCLGLR